MFSVTNIRTMARECANQKSGEMSVADLASAVYFAGGMVSDRSLSPIDILIMGRIIEPKVNATGFRTLPVFIDGKVAGVNPDSIERALKALCEAYNEGRITREELYQEFESIHPFADGNGRVGFVLYNLANLSEARPLQDTPAYIKS